MNIFKKIRKHYCVIFILACLFTGIIMTPGYGSYWDYTSEKAIVYDNISQYIVNVNGDLASFKEKHPGIKPVSETEEYDHGAAIYYPLAWLFNAVQAESNQYLIWKLYTFLLFFTGAVALYLIGKLIYKSKKMALFLFGLFFFSPLMFAYGHINNKDIVFLSFTLWMILFCEKWILSKKRLWAVLLACSCGFATNSKILGGWYLIVLAVYAAYAFIKGGRKKRFVFLDIIIVFLISIACYCIITPAVWDDPIEKIQYIIISTQSFNRWPGNVLFAGNIYGAGKTPFYYLAAMVAITTPVGISILSLLGHIRAVFFEREKKSILFALMLLWLVPFIYASFSSNTILYNEWRHFFFIYGSIILLAGEGAEWISHYLNNKTILAGAGYVCILICLVISGHPYQYAYTNLLAGNNAESKYELDYWNLSYKECIEKLINYEGRNQDLALTIGDGGSSGVSQTLKIMRGSTIKGISEDENSPNYFLVSSLYSKLYCRTDGESGGYHLLFTTKAYGNELVRVYEKIEFNR